MAIVEVRQAIKLLRDFLGRNKSIPSERVEKFCGKLEQLLCTRYKNHWHPERPHKGSAYRCLRMSDRLMDPVIALAAMESEVSKEDIQSTLPTELTVWIDPFEVSYRIGEDGSICQLFVSTEEDMKEESKRNMAPLSPALCRVESLSGKRFENAKETLQECMSG